MFAFVFHLWIDSLGYAQTIKDCNPTSLIHLLHLLHVWLYFPPCPRSATTLLVFSARPKSSIVSHWPESIRKIVQYSLASSPLVQRSQKWFTSPSKSSNTRPAVLEVSGNPVFCLTEGLVSLSIILLPCPSLPWIPKGWTYRSLHFPGVATDHISFLLT
jgi:hypothetical protein